VGNGKLCPNFSKRGFRVSLASIREIDTVHSSGRGEVEPSELVTVVRVEHAALRLSIGVQTSPALGRF